jgi:hypothetical protein
MPTEVTCTVSPCEVIVQVTPAPPNVENIADLMDLGYAFMGLLVGIYAIKKLIALFNASERDD